MWDRYQRGERKAFSKRLYTPAGQKAFDEVARKYRADRAFKQTRTLTTKSFSVCAARNRPCNPRMYIGQGRGS